MAFNLADPRAGASCGAGLDRAGRLEAPPPALRPFDPATGMRMRACHVAPAQTQASAQKAPRGRRSASCAPANWSATPWWTSCARRSQDPALAGVSVTITEVRISPDLKHALCFVEPLGGEEAPEVIDGAEPASRVPARPAGPRDRHEVHPGPEVRARRQLRRRRAHEPPARRPARAPRPERRPRRRGRGLMGRRRKGDAVSGWICLDKPLDLRLDPGGRPGAAGVQRPEGRPRRHARSAGHRHPADRAGRGDQDRAVPDGRRQDLSLHHRLGRRRPPASTARAR